MRLDAILERNQEFVRGRAPRPLPPPEPIPVAVVGCYDPRLDDILRPALGLAHGEAIILRAAGARLVAGGDPLRSLGLAAFLFGITE
jgi:carbonic anhydrase